MPSQLPAAYLSHSAQSWLQEVATASMPSTGRHPIGKRDGKSSFMGLGALLKGTGLGKIMDVGPPNEMVEAAAQWGRHAAWSASRAAQAAAYAAEQAKQATHSAQNSVTQMVYLMNHPELRGAQDCIFGPGAPPEVPAGAVALLAATTVAPKPGPPDFERSRSTASRPCSGSHETHDESNPRSRERQGPDGSERRDIATSFL
mmetsp:Transcript_65513/g.122231  ORF Transcript_65513/g.122231 Transcript_65513/m.122231 type:complete len:202 (+) Transcript_65513:88-693(+)